MLQLKNIHMSFGERVLFDNVSLRIAGRKIVSISGKSGSGKSTLLGIMSGLLKPDSGEVLYNNKNIFKWNDFRRSIFRNREIGFVFQFFSLFDDMTAYDNIILPSIINPSFKVKMKKNELDDLIDLLNIRTILNDYPKTLSGGERQRVAIARAIINKPRLVLADEPTGNLDIENTMEILNLFKFLRDHFDITIVIVTHEKLLVDQSDIKYRAI
jgi:ABC-type lipoprotein export system ATPase subunit